MLALPLELLIEILKALEWSDLLRIRQVGLSFPLCFANGYH